LYFFKTNLCYVSKPNIYSYRYWWPRFQDLNRESAWSTTRHHILYNIISISDCVYLIDVCCGFLWIACVFLWYQLIIYTTTERNEIKRVKSKWFTCRIHDLTDDIRFVYFQKLLVCRCPRRDPGSSIINVLISSGSNHVGWLNQQHIPPVLNCWCSSPRNPSTKQTQYPIDHLPNRTVFSVSQVSSWKSISFLPIGASSVNLLYFYSFF
jgi:hypothetical protein